MEALWNGQIIAESINTINNRFPRTLITPLNQVLCLLKIASILKFDHYEIKTGI
jgi:hypothetical protein